jgi:hypothetical protein
LSTKKIFKKSDWNSLKKIQNELNWAVNATNKMLPTLLLILQGLECSTSKKKANEIKG